MRKLYCPTLILLFLVLMISAKAQAYTDKSWFNNPVRANYYEIKNKAQYEGLIQLVNDEGMTFAGDTVSLTLDLSLSGLVSLSSFSGTLLGNGHTISELGEPLVSTLAENGRIESLTFDKSCYVSDYGSDVGMVARVCNGVLKDIVNYGSVTVSRNDYFCVGGLCGSLEGGTLLGCVNRGKVSANVSGSSKVVLRAGGLCGYMSGSSVRGCINYGEVVSFSYAYALSGGITGDCQGGSKIDNCINRGLVSSTLTGTSSLTSSQVIQYTGGIAGQMQEGAVINMCSNYAEVSNNTQYVSGIVAHAGKSSIFNCVNDGHIISTDGPYFSCASGICSYYDALSLDNEKYFMNCINTGNISSTAKYAQAVAAGICNEIKYAKVGNLKSTGSVSASAAGSLSAKFEISQYDTEGCEILSDATTIETANAFIDTWTGKSKLVKWEDDGSGKLQLVNSFIYYIEPYQGLAEIRCIKENDNNVFYDVRYTANGKTDYKAILDYGTITGLMPDTEYDFGLSRTGLSSVVEGTFKTLPVDLRLTFDSIGYTEAYATMSIRARGVKFDEYGVKYRLSGGDSWMYQKARDNKLELTSLNDNASYDVIPYYIYKGKEGEGEYVNLKTKELKPLFENTGKTSSTLSFRVSNLEELHGFKYGVSCDGRDVYSNDDGTVTLDSLRYYEEHVVSSFIEKHGDTYRYELGTFATITFGTEAPVQLSPTAAMVRGLAYDESKKLYEVYIQYRKLTDPDNVKSTRVEPIKTDNHYEYCVTFDIKDKDVYQYRILKTNGYSEGSQWYEEKAGDWLIANPSEATTDVVKPVFMNIEAYPVSQKVTLRCSNVYGEEKVSEVGIEYKVKGSDKFNKMKMSSPGSLGGYLTWTFSSLVKNIEYVGRFYNVTEGKTYYSPEFIFDSECNLKITGDGGESGINGNKVDRGITKITGIYDILGRKTDRFQRGDVNIIRYSDGSVRKVLK